MIGNTTVGPETDSDEEEEESMETTAIDSPLKEKRKGRGISLGKIEGQMRQLQRLFNQTSDGIEQRKLLTQLAKLEQLKLDRAKLAQDATGKRPDVEPIQIEILLDSPVEQRITNPSVEACEPTEYKG